MPGGTTFFGNDVLLGVGGGGPFFTDAPSDGVAATTPDNTFSVAATSPACKGTARAARSPTWPATALATSDTVFTDRSCALSPDSDDGDFTTAATCAG